MKRYLFFSLTILFGTSTCLAQTVIAPTRVSVTYSKTTTLIFDYPIITVDVGSPTVIAKIPKRATNVLELKAASHAGPETNGSVVTADGHFYAFTMVYAQNPDSLVLRLPPATDSAASSSGRILFPSIGDNKAFLWRRAVLLQAGPATYGLHVHRFSAGLWVRQIAIDSTCLWFELVLTNQSRVPFPIDELTFSIQTKRQSRRTAVQSHELTPLYTSLPSPVTVHRPQSVVLAFHPFTVSPKQRLIIRVRERKGSRILNLSVTGRQLLRARWLNS